MLRDRLLVAAMASAVMRLAARGAGGGRQVIHDVIKLNGRTLYEEIRPLGWRAEKRSGRELWTLSR